MFNMTMSSVLYMQCKLIKLDVYLFKEEGFKEVEYERM